MNTNNKKLKVCLISRSAYPLFNTQCRATFGGAEVDLYILAKELAKDQDFSVSVIVGDFGQSSKIEYFDSVKIIKGYKISELKIIQMLKLIIKIISTRADVYIQESASGGTGIIAVVCRLMGSKFIYRAASIIDCNGEFIKNNKVEGFLFSLGLKFADSVITQTQIQQDELKRTIKLNSLIIKNAIKLPQQHLENREYCLWIGRSEELKQPELFLDLAEKLPLYKFIMICPTANLHSVDMQELMKRAKKIPNLEFINGVSFSEVDSYYKNAILFVNTSTYEGFPNTFVQATAHGVPIVSLNVNPDNFIGDYNCGKYTDGNFETLTNYVQTVLSEETLQKQLTKNSYRYALENHDISKIIIKYKELIKKIYHV